MCKKTGNEEVYDFKGRKGGFAHVKDEDDNEYLCAVGAFKHKKDSTEEELKGCVSDVHTAVGTWESG